MLCCSVDVSVVCGYCLFDCLCLFVLLFVLFCWVLACLFVTLVCLFACLFGDVLFSLGACCCVICWCVVCVCVGMFVRFVAWLGWLCVC